MIPTQGPSTPLNREFSSISSCSFFFVPTYHSQQSITLLSVCRELQAASDGKKSDFPTAMCFRGRHSICLANACSCSKKANPRTESYTSGSRSPLRRSTLSPAELFHQACRVNEVFVDRLFIFSFFCESAETEMTQERDQKRHQKRDFETRTRKVSTV